MRDKLNQSKKKPFGKNKDSKKRSHCGQYSCRAKATVRMWWARAGPHVVRRHTRDSGQRPLTSLSNWRYKFHPAEPLQRNPWTIGGYKRSIQDNWSPRYRMIVLWEEIESYQKSGGKKKTLTEWTTIKPCESRILNNDTTDDVLCVYF